MIPATLGVQPSRKSLNVIAAFTDAFGSTDGFELDFDHFPATLGRGEDSSIVLADRWISRLHCRIVIEGQYLVVTDLCSRHGTFVNGERVEEAIICPGDELQVGLHVFIVQYEHRELQSLTHRAHSDDSRLTASR